MLNECKLVLYYLCKTYLKGYILGEDLFHYKTTLMLNFGDPSGVAVLVWPVRFCSAFVEERSVSFSLYPFCRKCLQVLCLLIVM